MTNKLTLTEQEELFAKDCKLINLKYEYNGYTGDEKWAIITELSVKELWEKYPLVIERYSPFVHLSIAQGEVIDEDLREYIGTVDDDKLFRQINATLKKTFGLWVYKPEGKENIRCLCQKCLNDYIHNPDYIVRRLDPFAKRKDRCDKCDGDGWDYVVTDRYSSKKEKRCKNV